MTEQEKLALEPQDEARPIRAFRRISTNEIILHVGSGPKRREIAATESLILSDMQALRLANDIMELVPGLEPQPDAETTEWLNAPMGPIEKTAPEKS